MTDQRWQFWIDVGGTFTDCLVQRPDGTTLRHKRLSSGVTKGSVGPNSRAGVIVDPRRQGEPADFYRGYQLRLLNAQGTITSETAVETFDAQRGELHLAEPLEFEPDQAYELASGEEAPIVAVRFLLGLTLDDPLPPLAMRLGTTRGTNALLTRNGARTALVTTQGFGDILHIGYQNRPQLFDLNINKPIPLYQEVVEVEERLTCNGDVLTSPDEATIRSQLKALHAQGIQSLAICLLNAYAHPTHEQQIARLAYEVGFTEVSVSSRVAPLIKLVSRGDTTVADAYLNPVLREYVAGLRAALDAEGKAAKRQANGENASSSAKVATSAASSLRILTSAGGLVEADQFVGKDSILSGPAGGVVGFAAAATAAGFTQAIGFDMGGTSTDVARFDGSFQYQYETEKAGVRIVAPMMAIETVAAGGGSICWFDGVKLCVGPASAGADPGPACYGRGGPLAVTDVNLTLGKLLPERFPFQLDLAAVDKRLDELIEEIATATGKHYSRIELAQGFLQIANATMASAIASVSIAQGCDPADYVLVAFGGAAGQHACALASELGIEKILNHPDAGILSAYGIGRANVERHAAEGIYTALEHDNVATLEENFQRLTDKVRTEVQAEGISPDRITVTRSLDLRYQGLDSFLTIAEPNHSSEANWATAYARQHQQLYGYVHDDRPLEVVAARVTATGSERDPPPTAAREEKTFTPKASEFTTTFFAGQPQRTAIFPRDELTPGAKVAGPVIILEAVATTIVDPGWQAEMLTDGQLLITPLEGAGHSENHAAGRSLARPHGGHRNGGQDGQADPVMLEIFNNHFAGIAHQMGITLRNTSSSVNVKERLDFSCAVFTAAGELVVNAPHIPVHLGAMGLTVRHVLKDNPTLAPGDVIVTNDPYRGGSHLPDITVVTPVFDHASGELIFFTASRAHHAEIGGIRAGSMPPFSTNLAEEGVLIRNFKLIDGGQSRFDQLQRLLLEAEYPSRSPADNLADIGAQVAANQQGARDLGRLVDRYSQSVVTGYMRHIQAAAESKTRAALSRLPNGSRTFTDHLDDGSPIVAAITIDGDAATIDFTGTGDVLKTNLNANRAIVTAAVMYVLRLLIDEDIPLNEGVLAPVDIVLPTCLLNPPGDDDPSQCAAVAGGNVETSQRVVDVLLGALGIAAASQGTMNNLLFGDATFGYYETIGGGAGATPQANGADAVHTHMTNTRLTDPEVLEQRYPVRVREFAIRAGSGGDGLHRGGHGMVREIEFLKQLDVSLLTSRRGEFAPYGIEGGQAGKVGKNRLTRASGSVENLDGVVQFTAEVGDVLRIETPGGGGFGGKT